MQAKFSNAFDSLTRQVKALRQTPLEKDVTDATSNDNWGVANSALIELARATNDYTNYAVVMKGVWEGIGDKKERWRRIFKSMVLLEYCVKNGSDRCGDEARSELHKIRALEDFKFMEEGRDKGAGIRDKAKQLVELLSNSELLKAEKAKARESKEKYVGIASNSAGGQTIVAPSGYVSGTAVNASSSDHAVSNDEVNGTSKLDEYREKDRIRREAAAAASKAPVLSNSGKIIVKAPPTKPATKEILYSSSSSSSSEDDLIDFDPKPVAKPVVKQAAPQAVAPFVQPQYAQQPAPNPYAQVPPQYGQTNPYAQAAPQYNQPNPYAQAAAQYGRPNPYAQAAAQYGQPNPYAQAAAQYGQAAPYAQAAPNPYAQATPQYGQAPPNPYAQASPQPRQEGQSAVNPFAFNGL